MPIIIFSVKTVFTIAFYLLRILIEGSLIEYKKFHKYILDLAFVGLILIGYNLPYSTKSPGTCIVFNWLQTALKDVTEFGCIILMLIAAFVIWYLTVYLISVYEKSMAKANIHKGIKVSLIGGSGFLAGILFYAALLIQ